MSCNASLPVRRQPATERTKFIVCALWLSGFSAAQIARHVGGRRAVALGFARRSPWGDRAAMSLAERQEVLVELRAIRCDAAGAISRPNREISMKLSVALRSFTLGAVALLSVGCFDGGYREGYYGRQLPVYRDDLDRGYRRPDSLHARRPIYRRRSASYDRAQSFINANNANRRNFGNGSHSSFGGRSGSSGSFGGRR